MTLENIFHIKPYEKTIYVLRRHYITFVPYILIFIILMLVPIALYWLVGGMFPNFFNGAVAYPLSVLFASIYYLSLYLFFFSYFVEFYLDMWIITNDRLVDIKQISLFARTIAEVDLYQIQDVSSDVRGFFPSLFNYGNVTLQTAGPVPKFILYNVHRPHALRQALIELSSEDKKYHSNLKPT